MTDGESDALDSADSEFLGIDAVGSAGALLFAVGGVALLGIVTAEVLYPGYTTLQEISDLGASRPPNSVVRQPAATVFNGTMLLSGVVVIVATLALHRAIGRPSLSVPLGLFGFGILGVGAFPGNVVPWHMLFALLTFVAGGLTPLSAARTVGGPFRLISLVAGGISLAALASALFLGAANPLLFLGLGGIERWVVYPVLLWVTGFGGYLLGATAGPG